MSFLNPINEPVLMYSSTDANAPQIKYNARTVGDVKTVFKACLITGYGSKQGAGWTMQNETATVAEFVSPSVALSDYRFGIDDSTTSSTAYYYTYQNTKSTTMALQKSLSNIDTASALNAWIMLVTKLGLIFIESVYSNVAKANVARIMYVGQIKHALKTDGAKNFTMWNWGLSGTSYTQDAVTVQKILHIDNVTTAYHMTAITDVIKGTQYLPRDSTVIEVQSAVYWQANSRFLGEQPGLIVKTCNDSNKLWGVYNTTIDNRPMMYVCLGSVSSTLSTMDSFSVAVLIPLDNWSY